jgi:hypothetical protein
MHIHVDPNKDTDDATHFLGHSHEFIPVFRSRKISASLVPSGRLTCSLDATLTWFGGWYIVPIPAETSMFVNALELFIEDCLTHKIGTSVVYNKGKRDLPIRHVKLVVWWSYPSRWTFQKSFGVNVSFR